MEFLLLQNGQGVLRWDFLRFIHDKIVIKFIGAPAYSVVTIRCETFTIRHNLSETKEIEIDTKLVHGDVEFIISSRSDTWRCDKVRIERDDVGNTKVYSLTDYSGRLKEITDELATIKNGYKALKDDFKQMLAELEQAKKDYQII